MMQGRTSSHGHGIEKVSTAWSTAQPAVYVKLQMLLHKSRGSRLVCSRGDERAKDAALSGWEENLDIVRVMFARPEPLGVNCCRIFPRRAHRQKKNDTSKQKQPRPLY